MVTVLFIMHMPPPVHGASMVGKYIHDSELVNRTFDCHYINLTTATSLSDIGKARLGKVKSFVKLLNVIYREIERLKPNLVYITPNSAGRAFYKDFVVVKTIKKALRKVKGEEGRVVLHFHNKGIKTRQERWLDDRLYKRFFKGVKVMLLAEALYGDVTKYVKSEDVVFCGNGIPDFPLENVVKDNDVPRLLFLSNMMATKGVWELLDALAILKRKGLHFFCDFVGGWKDVQPEEFQARVQKYGLENCVEAHGAKYGMAKEAFFQRAHVFVFPTFYHNECFPLVLLEAMMHGLACISTNEGGISGIIEDGKTGIIVNKNNPQELASVLEVMLSDMERCRAMGIEGRKRFDREFTLKRFEERFCNCLKGLINI